MFHAAEVDLHAMAPSMRAFRDAMTEALARGLGE
jgi:hypothetical protein